MKLALITQDFPPEIGGVQTYSIELASRFARRCGSFLTIAPAKPTAGKIDRQLDYPVHRIACRNPLLGIKAMFQVPPLLEKQGIRHVFHAQWQTLPISFFARKQGIIDKVFVAVHARELLFNPFGNYPIIQEGYEKYKRLMLSQADLFFPVSDYMGDVLRRHGVEDELIQVIINGTNPQEFYPTDSDAARRAIGVYSDKMLLSVARLVSKKGIDTALRAFKMVLKDHPNSCYIIVGDGPQRKYLEKLARDLDITDAVRFKGLVPHEDIVTYYNACNVLVQPSKTESSNVEGCPLVFLEANACGKPVIGTFSGGISAAVVNGETGILVEERNPRALSKAINRFFDEPDLAVLMGEKGRKRVEDVANWDVVSNRILAAIEKNAATPVLSSPASVRLE